MASVFVTIGAAALVAAPLVFAWTAQRRQSRKGRKEEDSDDAVGTFYVS